MQKIRKIKREKIKRNTRKSAANNNRTENIPTAAAPVARAACERVSTKLKCGGGEYYISNYDYIVFFALPLFAKCAFLQNNEFFFQAATQQQRRWVSSSQLIYNYYFFFFRILWIIYLFALRFRIPSPFLHVFQRNWNGESWNAHFLHSKTSRSPDKLLLVFFRFFLRSIGNRA